MCVFFFQAEDGIRDLTVTGVQTCALPILRDLVQAKPAREDETLALLERFFDRILVHGDRRLASFERTFRHADRLAGRLHYTGYVVEEPAAPSRAGVGEVLVSAGGGAVGAA